MLVSSANNSGLTKCEAFGRSLRGDFLQNRVLGAQNQSDARMGNSSNESGDNMAASSYIV